MMMMAMLLLLISCFLIPARFSNTEAELSKAKGKLTLDSPVGFIVVSVYQFRF